VYRQVQGRDIAVAEENLRMGTDQIVINTIEQVGCPEAPAHGKYGADRGIVKHRVEVRNTLFDRTPKIPRPLADVRSDPGTEAEVTDGALGQREAIRVGDVGGRRDQPDGIPGPQNLRLYDGSSAAGLPE
jgi:hypothetical protein